MGGLVRVESFLRVLVVDDSSLYRQMLMRALAEVDGVEVIDVACDGVEALEKIERLQPDLVTLDVQMPKPMALVSCVKSAGGLSRQPS